MKLKKESHKDGYHSVNKVTELNNKDLNQLLLIFGTPVKVIRIHLPLQACEEIICHCDSDVIRSQQYVD